VDFHTRVRRAAKRQQLINYLVFATIQGREFQIVSPTQEEADELTRAVEKRLEELGLGAKKFSI
jgi:hypothetical protein